MNDFAAMNEGYLQFFKHPLPVSFFFPKDVGIEDREELEADQDRRGLVLLSKNCHLGLTWRLNVPLISSAQLQSE